jgi:hypothetical protein
MVSLEITHFKHLARNQLLHFFGKSLSAGIGKVAVDDPRQSIDRLTPHQNVEFDKVSFPVTRNVVVKRRIPARDRLQPVIKVEDDLRSRSGAFHM